MKRRSLPSKLRLGAAAAALLCLVLAADTWPGPDPASAQVGPEHSYVDLIMDYEYDSDDVVYRVRNVGTATAHGVTVSFLLEDLETYHNSNNPDLVTSNITGVRTDNDTKQHSFTWEVGTLQPGKTSKNLEFGTHINPNLQSELGQNDYNIGVINATASSITPEPDTLLVNNIIKLYSYFGHVNSGNSNRFDRHISSNRLALLLSVDDLRPAAGGAVDFDLTAQNRSVGTSLAHDDHNIVTDVNVMVELSDGLKFKEGWSPPVEFVRSGSQSATWQPAIIGPRGGFKRSDQPDHREIEIQVQLTSDSLDAIPLEERCITARVADSIPPPDPDYALGSLAQCLGDDPPLLFEQGTLQWFTPFPCVDADGTAITSYPCDASDTTSEIAVIAVADSGTLDPDFRKQGVGRSSNEKVMLLPEKGITVHVKDPSARVVSGSAVTWQTGRKYDVGTKTVPGVIVTYTAKDFLDTTSGKECPGATTCRWSGFARTIKVRGLTQGSTPPGGAKVIVNDKPYQTFHLRHDANSGNNYTHTRGTWNLGQYVSSYIETQYLEFTTLGTHVVDVILGVTRRSDSVVQEDTGTYIFHVGPIAELEVRDVGRNPSGQRAFTIAAVNNGPDTAPAAQVTLKGIPAGATVGHISEGSYDAATGVWTIGALESAEYRRARGRSPATLTLLTGAAAGTEITATISNTQDYAVCIDSSGNDVDAASESTCEGTTSNPTGNTWHTANYYDYISDNSTDVTIAARSGGGAALRTSQPTADISLSWSPRPGAAAYGIEVSEDGGATWNPLARWVRGTSYTHTGIPQGGTRHYQVHAIDGEGRRGIPFTTSSAVAGRGGRETSPPGAPEQMTLAATPASRTAILLSWVQPADYGSPITEYTLQVADGRNGPWANVNPQPGVNAVGSDYGGLQPNTRKYFRIRASNEFGGSLWSPVAEARTVAAGVPGPPRNAGAAPFGDNAISVFWTAPADDGHAAVTQYEVQWSADGVSGWSRAGSTTTTSLNHTGLGVGDTRHYRVRARNAQGWGPWSLPPHATATTPGAELLEDYPSMWAEPSGQSAVVIAWLPPFDREGRDITRYELQWFEEQGIDCYADSSAGKYATLRRPSGSESSYTHTGLKPSLTYCYRLRAGTTAVWSDWVYAEATTEQAGTPAATSLTVRASGATEIKLSWSRPGDGGSRITGYELEWAEDPAAHNWSWVDRDGLPAGALSYTDAGLAPGTERHYRIRAVNANGPGQWSAVRGATTVAAGPGVPTGLTATAHATHQQIDLRWEAPADTGGSPITGYWLERSRDGDAPWERLTSRNATAWSDTRNLYPGMTRYYRVAAVNRSGAGVWSEVVASDATAIPAGGAAARAPDAPTALRFTSVGRDSVSFAWDRPAGDGGAPITGYEYQETLAEENIATTGTTGTIRGLEEGLHYSFRVRAVNAVGGGEWSEDIYTTVWPGRSEQVRVSATNITVTEGGTVNFTVSLSQAPPLPVGLGIYPRGSAADILYETYAYLDRALVPSGWSHPDGDDWSRRAHNWSRGVPVSITIPDDDVDNPDRVLVIDLSVGPLSVFEVDVSTDEWNAKWGIDPQRRCPGDPASACPTEWDRAVFRDFTGPSVRITVRDND